MSKHVLVVEDDLLNRAYYCAVLEGSGFQIEAVDDGAQALRAAKCFLPDLIIMDINLPNISGIDVIKMLRAESKFVETPVLAITAYFGKGEERHIRQAGATHYSTKPISMRPLLDTITELLHN